MLRGKGVDMCYIFVNGQMFLRTQSSLINF